MSTNFHVIFKKSSGNLHVNPKGDFDGSSAWELVNLIHKKYDGTGSVFIDTNNLGQICSFGCDTFQCQLNRHIIPFDRLIFKGEKGYDMAPKGSKVIIPPQKHHCGGNCTYCRCKNKIKTMPLADLP